MDAGAGGGRSCRKQRMAADAEVARAARQQARDGVTRLVLLHGIARWDACVRALELRAYGMTGRDICASAVHSMVDGNHRSTDAICRYKDQPLKSTFGMDVLLLVSVLGLMACQSTAR